MLSLQSRIRPVPALACFAGILGIAAWLAANDGPLSRDTASQFGIYVFRLTLLAVIGVAIVGPWLAGLRARQGRRAFDAQAATPASSSAICRADLYIVLAIALGALALYAQSQRYTVTHYELGKRIVYQRTDAWTGRAELWIVGGEKDRSMPPPAWIVPTVAE